MPELHGRALMENRFGPLGCGEKQLAINGTEYDIPALLSQLGLEFDDAKPIDALATDKHYVVRYFDAQDARVVAFEFDEHFHMIQEMRAHIAEWVGEDAYFSFYGGH